MYVVCMYDSCVYVSTVHGDEADADARSWSANKARDDVIIRGPCLETDDTCLLGTDYLPTGCLYL